MAGLLAFFERRRKAVEKDGASKGFSLQIPQLLSLQDPVWKKLHILKMYYNLNNLI